MTLIERLRGTYIKPVVIGDGIVRPQRYSECAVTTHFTNPDGEEAATEIERLTAQVERMRAHLTGMMEAAANYVEPTTYIARHPNLSTIGDCLWVREFPEPDQHQSVTGKCETRNRRDQAFIRDMIYMLDGPEQRAALSDRGGD